MSYYGTQSYGYQPPGIDDYQRTLVLQKLTDGFTLAAVVAAIMVFVPEFAPMFLLFAVVGYIVSILGYFFARNEGTINTLYFVFVASSSAFLGWTFQVLLAVLDNGAQIILGAFGGTAIIVGYLWYKVDSELPDPAYAGRNLTKYSVIFIVALLLGWFVINNALFYLIISVAGAALFSLYFYYDLARLKAGQYQSPARMAWSMYWDILLIFRYLLNILVMLFGSARD